MSVFRIEKTKNYTVMGNYHFKEKNMSLKSKGLLSLMLSLPDDWDYSIAGLVTLSNDGESSVRSALKELEQFGYLKRNRVRKDGKIADIEYVIFEQPNCDFLNVENLIQENLIQENNGQLNTNIINNLKNKNTKKTLAKNEIQHSTKNTKKTKKEKAIDNILAKLEEYDFSDKVKENILNYFSDQLDANNYPQANYLEMQLNGLSQHKDSEQLQAIEKAIQGQWKSMLYTLEKPKYQTRSGFTDTASRDITQEQREQERIEKEIFKEKLKNNDSSLHTF